MFSEPVSVELVTGFGDIGPEAAIATDGAGAFNGESDAVVWIGGRG